MYNFLLNLSVLVIYHQESPRHSSQPRGLHGNILGSVDDASLFSNDESERGH